jgi:hypothetical protein
MRILGPVVQTLVRSVFDVRHDLPLGRSIGAQLVSDHPLGERPVSEFCRTSQLGDVLALEPALVQALIPDLRDWHGADGDYFRR